MSQNSRDAIDVLSEVIVDTIDKKLGTAKFDKSQTGVVTSVNGNTYTISVFGSQYNITSDQVFTVGQSVVVTALQGDMKRLVCSPDNIGTMKTVDSKVNVIGDKVDNFIGNDFADTIIKFNDVKDQIDGSYIIWFESAEPTMSNSPAKDWTTADAKKVHVGDLYYNKVGGTAYKWAESGDSYSWSEIINKDILKVLNAASRDNDTVDGKRRVFYETPTTPYDQGDVWARVTPDGFMLICQTGRTIEDSYQRTDWVVASKYTDDFVADRAEEKADKAQSSADKANKDLVTFKTEYDSDLKITKEQIEARVTATTYSEDMSGLKRRVSSAETKISQNADAITLRATKEEVSTAKSDAIDSAAADATSKATAAESNAKSYADAQLKVTNEKIETKVSKGDIASTINQTAQSVQIEASKIDLKGAVTTEDISADGLNAKVIQAGTITATEIKADTITAGNIASGQIIRKLWQNATAGTYKGSNGAILPFQMSTFPAQYIELESSDLSQIQIIFKGNRFQSGGDNDKNCFSFSSMLVPLFNFGDDNAGSDNAIFYTASVPLPSSRDRAETEKFFVPSGTPVFSFRSFEVQYAKNTSGIGGYLGIYFWDAAIQNQDGSISFGANYNDWCIPYRIFGMK